MSARLGSLPKRFSGFQDAETGALVEVFTKLDTAISRLEREQAAQLEAQLSLPPQKTFCVPACFLQQAGSAIQGCTVAFTGPAAGTLSGGSPTSFGSNLLNWTGTPDREAHDPVVRADWSGTGTGTIVLNVRISIPSGFTGWNPNAIQLDFGASGSSISSAGYLSSSYAVTDPYNPGTTVTGTGPTLTEVGGVLTGEAYAHTLLIPASQLNKSLQAGDSLSVQFSLTAVDMGSPTLTINFGRLVLDWK